MVRRSLAEWWDDFRAKLAETVAYYGIGLSLLLAAAIVGFQVIGWARTGRWEPFPLSYLLMGLHVNFGWPYDATEWIGLANVARWLLDLHASLYIAIIVPWLSWWVGALIYKEALNGKRDERSQKKITEEVTK